MLIADPSRTYTRYLSVKTPFAYGGQNSYAYEVSKKDVNKDSISGFVSSEGFKPPKEYVACISTLTLGTATCALGPYSPVTSGKYFTARGFPSAVDSFDGAIKSAKGQALNNALMALQNKLDDSITSMGENACEIGQTYSMFQRVVTSSVNFTMCLRDRDIKGAFRELQKYGFSVRGDNVIVPKKYISKAHAKSNGFRNESGRRKSQYYEKPIRRSKDQTAEGLLLEYNFGLAPLLDDVEKVLTRFAYRNVDGFWRISPEAVVHKKKASGTGSSRSYLYKSDDYFTAKMYYTVNVDCEVRTWYNITNMQVMKNRQLGLGNALDLLWNLTPSSWLVDYFTNVGNLIGNLHMWSGLKYIIGCASYRITVESSREGSSLVGGWKQGGWNIHQYRSRGFIRQILTSAPYVSPQFTGADALSLTQQANTLAFSIQKLRNLL